MKLTHYDVIKRSPKKTLNYENVQNLLHFTSFERFFYVDYDFNIIELITCEISPLWRHQKIPKKLKNWKNQKFLQHFTNMINTNYLFHAVFFYWGSWNKKKVLQAVFKSDFSRWILSQILSTSAFSFDQVMRFTCIFILKKKDLNPESF